MKNLTGLPYIIPQWSVPKHIKAYSTLRYPGHSEKPYAEFNLAFHVGDTEEKVLANRVDLARYLSLPSEPQWLNQVHSNKPMLAEENGNQEADAAYTQCKHVVCTAMTADCLPLLVTNQAGTEIAAIHAGWRGLANGVIENTLLALQSKPHTLIVWIGPSISRHYYEVGEEVYTAFEKQHTAQEMAQAFYKKETNEVRQGKWLADMPLLAMQRLLRRGVEIQNIFLSGECTYAHPDRYFSYRRDGVTGRMASLIWRDDYDTI